MKSRKKIFGGAAAMLVVSVVIFAAFSIETRAPSPPTLALPDLSGHCLAAHAYVTTALTASNLPNISGWQVNVTYDSYDVRPMSFTWGSQFPTSNGYTGVKNGTGYYEIGYAYQNGATITTASQTTLVTFTWRTLVYHAFSWFHIVNSTENPAQGTFLLNQGLKPQPYNTLDGDLSCQV